MKGNNHHVIRNNTNSLGAFVKRAMVALFLLIGGICLTSYSYLFQASVDNAPISSNLPSPSFASAGVPERELPKIEIKSCPIDQVTGCQEIVDVTGHGDTVSSLLNANLADERAAKEVAKSLASKIREHTRAPFDENTAIKPGRRYEIVVDGSGALLKASIELDSANVFYALVEDGKLKTWKEEVVLDFKTETLTFNLKGSLLESLLSIGESPELAAKLTNVFRWDIDFQSECVKGDACRVLFERRYADDKPSGYGAVLCAIYEGRKIGKKTAVLFSGEYYDESGIELKKNFLRSPLSVCRVTSHYGRRFHPILRVWRKHNGVDYGAAQGTPVYAVNAGIVSFAGWQKGYGNYVCIKHDNGYESRYGHLQRYMVKVGQRVKQRQTIGLVGMTGIASGPHLDFQLLRKDKHVNPLSVKMVRSLNTVPGLLKPRFASVAGERISALGKPTLIRASGQFRSSIY